MAGGENPGVLDSWRALLADINMGLRKGAERLGRMLAWKGAV